MEKTKFRNRNTKLVSVLISTLCLALFTGCGSVDQSGGNDQGSNDPGVPSGTTDSPLYLQVYSNYEGNSNSSIELADCFWANTVAPSPANSKTCTVRIPELKLYYSDLKFVIGTNSSTTCTAVNFRPYYFLRSTSATYSPDGGPDTIDCSAADDIGCWGGAGPGIFGTDFLKNSGRYFLPTNVLSFDFKLPSSNTTRQTSTDRSFNSTNVHSSNALATGSRGGSIANPVNYVGGSMRDYIATCEDKWANTLYSITLIISDEDTTNLPHDDGQDRVYDWGDP